MFGSGTIRSRLRLPFLCGLILVCMVHLPATVIAQSRFEQIRGEVYSPASGNSGGLERDEDDGRTCRHGRRFCSECDLDDINPAEEFVGNLAGALIWGGAEALAHEFGSRTYFFPHYPYADGHVGYLMHENDVPARPQTGAIRARAHYTNDFSGVERVGSSLLIERTNRWGVEGEISYLVEERFLQSRDRLWLGDVNLLYRILSSENSVTRAGVGMNWLNDSGDVATGINGSLLFEWFPAKPVTIASQFDIGRIGSAKLIHLESTVGLSWEHLELFGGFDYRRIGSVDLAGPIFGIRGWW